MSEDITAEPKQVNQPLEEKSNLATGGHELPENWLLRIVLIWSGYAVSMFAGNASSYAGIWYVTETTGSPSILAFLYVLAFLPAGLLSPFGGVIADKYNRKVIIIICDAIMAVNGVALAIWIALAGPSVAAVAVFCIAFGITSGFRTPAFNATMPLLVPERHLMRINGLDTLLGSVSMIAAPVLGILLYTTFGLQASILLGGIGAFAAVVTMFLAKLPRITAEKQLGPWQSLKEGASALAANRGLLVLTIAVALGMLAYGPIDSLMPLMVSSHFGGDGFAASLVAAVMGAGLLVGALTLMAANPQHKLARIIIVAAFIVGAGAFVAGLIPSNGYWMFVVCIGLLAIACAWFNAPLMTLLQKGYPHSDFTHLFRIVACLSGADKLHIPYL